MVSMARRSASARPIHLLVLRDFGFSPGEPTPPQARLIVQSGSTARLSSLTRNTLKPTTTAAALYYRKNDHDRAIADLAKAIELDPKFALADNSRGSAYWDKYDHDRAIADYTGPSSLTPNSC
jgi:tetratricopeptide (TPR) repeat protein